MSDEANEKKPSFDTETQLDALDRTDMALLTSGHDVALNELMERHAGRLFNYLNPVAFKTRKMLLTLPRMFSSVSIRTAPNSTPTGDFSTWLYAIANEPGQRSVSPPRSPSSSVA